MLISSVAAGLALAAVRAVLNRVAAKPKSAPVTASVGASRSSRKAVVVKPCGSAVAVAVLTKGRGAEDTALRPSASIVRVTA